MAGKDRKQTRQPATKQPHHQKKLHKNPPHKPGKPGQKFFGKNG